MVEEVIAGVMAFFYFFRYICDRECHKFNCRINYNIYLTEWRIKMKYNGLTDKEVEASREKYGSNMIPDSEPTTFWQEFK